MLQCLQDTFPFLKTHTFVSVGNGIVLTEVSLGRPHTGFNYLQRFLTHYSNSLAVHALKYPENNIPYVWSQ